MSCFSYIIIILAGLDKVCLSVAMVARLDFAALRCLCGDVFPFSHVPRLCLFLVDLFLNLVFISPEVVVLVPLNRCDHIQ